MSALATLFDLDVLLLPRNVAAVFRYAWRRDRSQNFLGAVHETLHCLLRTNIYPIFIDVASGWTLPALRALLVRYGIELFGAYEFGGEWVFYVRLGQANFAEWVLRRAGVPLKYGVLAKRVGRRTQPGGSAQPPSPAPTPEPPAQPPRGLAAAIEADLDALGKRLDDWLGL